MSRGGFLPAYILSAIVAGVAALAAASGLFLPGLYRDNARVIAAWQGNDIVTLLVADVEAIRLTFRPATPVAWISGLMLLIPLLMGGIELQRILSFFFTGQIPADIVWTGHPTGVIYATDLTLLMPALVSGRHLGRADSGVRVLLRLLPCRPGLAALEHATGGTTGGSPWSAEHGSRLEPHTLGTSRKGQQHEHVDDSGGPTNARARPHRESRPTRPPTTRSAWC